MYQAPSKDKLIMALIALIMRVGFLFLDAGFVKHSDDAMQVQTPSKPEIIQQDTYVHASAQPKALDSKVVIPETTIPEVETTHVDEQKLQTENYQNIDQKLSLSVQDVASLQLKDIKKNSEANTFEDTFILESLYNKTQNIAILKVLIEKLIQDYQFDKAYTYTQKVINVSGYQSIDPHINLYALLNSSELSVLRQDSIKQLQPIIDEYKVRSLLSMDDYRFYQALIQLRNRNYEWAKVLFKQIKTPRYQAITQRFFEIESQVINQRDMPGYYQDALTALMLLKNGYFTIAKKIALEVLSQDDTYILPYQILAYAHFVTNHRDTSVEYLFKLVDFDEQNKYLYKFLIWVSYYWLDKPEQSVLYLSQVADLALEGEDVVQQHFGDYTAMTDVYRYLLLNYISWEDLTRMIRTRQKMLWEEYLKKPDFYTYFYHAMYKPFMNGEEYYIYEHNPKLAEDFVGICYKQLPREEHDVCIYGHAGLDFLNNNGKSAREKLLYLARFYPQAYIFHTLWDYYYSQNQPAKAKVYYIKAISMTDNSNEEAILKKKLLEFVADF